MKEVIVLSEPRYISPMLDGFSLGQAISDHSGVECYPAMRDNSEKRYIVKKISLPASQVQVDALLLTGVFRNADAVRDYYEELARGVREEVQTLNSLADQRGFVPYQDCQVESMESGIGFEVYLLSRYRKTLERFTRRSPMTHLSAVNLGIDICAAMAVCREAGWLYVDLKPENIYLFGDQEYRIGDLGFIAMNSLKYASLPDRYRSLYTAPEVADAYSSLNATMDTYALGLVLYQIYNLGKLPYADTEERQTWLKGLAAGEAIEPPVCADEEMAGIILKACSLNPEDRWQTPAEMGHALISYMQRNGADDIPIALPEEPEAPEEEAAEPEQLPAEQEEPAVDTDPAAAEETPAAAEEADADEADASEEIPAEVTRETAGEEIPAAEEVAEPEEIPAAEETETPEAASSENEAVSAAEDTSADEEISAAEDTSAAEETAAEEEAPPAAESGDWIDLMDAILSEDADALPDQDEADEPSLRELLEDGMDAGDLDELTGEDVSAETADILSAAQELIDHEAPAPVVAPEPIDVPIPEPIPIELPEEESEAAGDEAPVENTEPEQSGTDNEEPASDTPAPIPEDKPGSLLWKKVLCGAAALAIAAGLGWGAWHYYQNYYLQTIDSMTYDGTGTQVTVTVTTAMDQSKLTVICKDTYGNAVEGTLENGAVTFSDLVPGSQYIITLEPEGFHKLVGTTSVTYSTPAETQLMHLTAVTGQEAGSAIISFGVEGRDIEEWTLTCTAEGEEPRTVAFTGHTVTVNELTVGTAYTFTLTAPEDVLLVGENVVQHTASDLVQASGLTLADYADGVITVSWTAPEGVDRWIVRCFDEAGYDQLQEVTGNTASFEGITEGGKYTVEVTAATMTLGVRAEITADRNNITGFTAALNGSAIELSWNYAGAIPEGGWKIAWSADGGSEQILTVEENKAVLSPAAPGSRYTFTIQPPEGSTLLGGTAELEVPAAGTFSANKLSADTIIVTMYDVPSKSNWGYSTLQRASKENTFKPGGSLALLYTVTKPYSFDGADFETIFVIRDAEGKLVSIATRTRAWDEMWDNGYCTEQVSNLPAAAGEYTLTIYIANGQLAQLPFTIK